MLDHISLGISNLTRARRFYDDLRAQARRVFYLTPGAGLAGPWVAVYRLRA